MTGISARKGTTDWRGIDDGSRKLPQELYQAAQQGGLETLQPQQRKQAGEAITGDMGIYTSRLGYNLKVHTNIGKSWQAGDTQWGGTLSLGYRNDWRNLEIDSKLYSTVTDNKGQSSTYITEQSERQRVENQIDLNALLTTGLHLGQNHKLGFNIMSLRQSTLHSELANISTLDINGQPDGTRFRQVLSSWSSNQIDQQQLYGQHHFYQGAAVLHWQITHSQNDYSRPFSLNYRYFGLARGNGYSLQTTRSTLEIWYS